ncbi:MAG: hypothetical protein GF393_09130 [Armatimonadia bacterium]|nr:hypothetical protein [Armatimonadia bacterium]
MPNRDDFEPDLEELSTKAERDGLEVTDEMLEEEAARQYADAISSTEELHRENLVWSGRRKLRLFRTTRLVIPARPQPGSRGTITFSCRHRIGLSGESHFSADSVRHSTDVGGRQ